jgi:hypothetical protein
MHAVHGCMYVCTRAVYACVSVCTVLGGEADDTGDAAGAAGATSASEKSRRRTRPHRVQVIKVCRLRTSAHRYSYRTSANMYLHLQTHTRRCS